MTRKEEHLRFFKKLGGKSLVDAVQTTERHLADYNRRYLTPAAPAGQWRILGAVESSHKSGQSIFLECEYGAVEVRIITSNCIRVRVAPQLEALQTEPFSYSVEKTHWPPVPFEFIEGAEALEIRTASHICRIGKQPFRIGLETLAGDLICVDALGAQQREDGAVKLSLKLHPSETSYGLGERAAALNLRGQHFQLWNNDHPDYERGSDPLYYNIPFYVGVHGDISYGVFWDNTSRGSVDIGKNTHNELSFEFASGEICYYLFTAPDVNGVVARYTELTGRIKLPPVWFLGYQQARFSYQNQDEILQIAREFRQHGIPCDVLYLDIHYMDQFQVFTWDSQRFPDPAALLKALHKLGYKVIAIVDPGIKIDPDYAPYVDGLKQDVFLKYPDGTLFSGAVWPGLCHFPDFTSPQTRDWWAEKCQPLLQTGIDGIWNDMCEPVMFTSDGGTLLPDYLPQEGDNHPATHREYRNVYGMQMARASLEGFKRAYPDKRPVNMVRSGYAGTQRYATSWTGDNASDWDHLRLSISMALNMGLSGAPMTGPDVGGFRGNADGELLTRWMQAACLMPYFRSHTTIETHPQEPWAFGQPYEVINRVAIELRYRLLPYLYSIVAQCREYGWPIIRPVFTAEPYNPDIRAIDDAYLLGNGLLVAPVLKKGALKRTVYLPAGDWYDYWTNECLEGGQEITTPAPLERLPLFVRAGAVLPMWSERQHTAGEPDTTQLMRFYPGDLETALYEDAGEGLGYEQGDYRWVYVSSQWDDDTLHINRRIAGKYQPAYKSLRLEIVGFDDEPSDVVVDRKGAPLWFFDDGLLELNVADFQKIQITQKSSGADRTILSRPR